MRLPSTELMKELIKNSGFIKWFKHLTRNNLFIDFLVKGFVSIIILAFSFIPFWGYLTVRWLMEPIDFWQEFAILAVCTVVLGVPQLGMILFGGVLILQIIIED